VAVSFDLRVSGHIFRVYTDISNVASFVLDNGTVGRIASMEQPAIRRFSVTKPASFPNETVHGKTGDYCGHLLLSLCACPILAQNERLLLAEAPKYEVSSTSISVCRTLSLREGTSEP
jgi:hypothetical protein